jgi:protocatechuate 3,4-dioxygenase beta subunit
MGEPGTARVGRTIGIVVNDDESELRTPSQPLYVLPHAARDTFTPMPPLPDLRSVCDLTRIARGRPQANGEVIEIVGKVRDEDARPVRDTLIEVWNANAHGRYAHTLDSGNTDSPLDPNFYGFGRLLTDSEGCYRLRTIKPGAYIARRDIGWWRPPHVHFSIIGNGLRLVTQVYFPDDPRNQRDFIHLYVPEADRPRVIAIPSAVGFRFDIVVRGRLQTPPEAD